MADKIITILGKVSLTPRGQYDATVDYEQLDIISHNGSSYLALKDFRNITPAGDDETTMLLSAKGNNLKFSDLTPEEVELLKLHFSDLTEDEIALLQQPAKDATNAAAGAAQKAIEATNLAKESTGKANAAAQRATDAAKGAEGIVSGIRPDYNVDDKTLSTFIANRPEIPTLPSAPTETTLNYVNSYGNTIAYRIGNEVRVLEGDSYAYYKLHNLENGKALWKLESGERVVKVNDLLNIKAGKTYAFLPSADNSAEGTLIETADHIDLLESLYMYGVEWTIGTMDPTCIRIGNMNLHRTLPIHNKMRRCLLKIDGTLNYYLDANDSSKKELLDVDGNKVDAILDGTDGHVMVEIGLYYYKYEKDGDTRRYKLSERPIPGYKKSKKRYISAFLMQRSRSTLKAASIINTTADYRGGLDYPTSEMIGWDGTEKSLLGKATTSRADEVAKYGNNIGKNWRTCAWVVYNQLHWLCVVEFGTHCYKLPFNAELTSDGFKQGGAAPGIMGCNGAALWEFNKNQPFLDNGVTLSLGNNTGVVQIPVNIPNLIAGNVIEANSYRGIEHPYSYWRVQIKDIMVSMKAGIANPIRYELYGREGGNIFYDLQMVDSQNAFNITPTDFYEDIAFLPTAFVPAAGKSYTAITQNINRGFADRTVVFPVTGGHFNTTEGPESFASILVNSNSQVNPTEYASARIEYNPK